jgi:hypothetical protein
VHPAAIECRRGFAGPGSGAEPFGHAVSRIWRMSVPSKEQVDSSDVGLALLGFASGSMDALAFFNLGEVFPSAMTGNSGPRARTGARDRGLAPVHGICRLSGRRGCGFGEC